MGEFQEALLRLSIRSVLLHVLPHYLCTVILQGFFMKGHFQVERLGATMMVSIFFEAPELQIPSSYWNGYWNMHVYTHVCTCMPNRHAHTMAPCKGHNIFRLGQDRAT